MTTADETRETNPYIEARGAFVSVYEDLAKGKRNWQLAALAVVGILAVQTIAFARLALTSRVTPYLVEVDRLGRVVALGPVEPLRQTETRLVVSQLVLFIESARTVVPSDAAEADIIRRAYAYADQGAATFLNAYFGDPRNDPRVLGRSMSRSVEVTSVLRVPKGETWRVQWTETEYPTGAGGEVKTTAWEGYLAIRVTPPATTEAVERNPLGVYITSMSWSRVGMGATAGQG
jgi:type IV secretory pathway TrbF-like protein